RHVASKLPRYMVPDLFLALEAMPLTSAGKTDRRTLQGMSLPENDNVDLSDNQPISETFAALRRALAETLDVDPARVVPSASFLRLGGDSISAIQFSSRCKRYGLKLTVADILKHPVLANLERCAEPMLDPVSPKYLMRPVGIVPHTAVVRQVIPDLRRVNHFNQSFLLKCRVPLSLLMLKQAVRALVAHHDILRIRLSTRNNEWEQEILELPDGIRDDFHLSRFALVTEANITLADYDDWVLRAQQAINIERGPVLVGSLLTVDAQPYVYFSVHHLCIDFVSWRILLEDLETLLQGQSLPTKTLSFREWATLVNGYAQTLPNDLWPNHGPVAELPIDSNPIPTEPITYHSVQSVSRSLGCEVSHALYGEAAPRVDTSPQEFMVASLVMALTTTFQLDSLEIQMEGHGRQPWSSDIDISRTLGWFTSIYPVAFHVKQAEHYSSLPQALRLLAHIKQRLRSVPDSGLPYGLLNDLKGRDPTLPTTPNPSVRPGGIIFNYTGRFEQLDALNAFWSPASLGDGWSHDLSLDELVRHALSVSCSYGAETGLSLHIQYSRLMYRERNVELLADRWLMQLQYLIRTALDCPVPCRTASDFGLASLSEPAFSRLVQVTLPTLRLTLEDVDDLYPCLPMQEGLLLATLKDPAAYMVQSTYDLLGPLDTKRLQVAWATTTQQHPILRTRFLLGLVDTQHANMQLVTKLAETHWSVSNWSGRDLEQAEAEYMRKEREEGFDLSQVPVRVGLFYVAPNRHRLITSIHHAVLDGWSSGMFMHALLRNYAGRVLPPAGQLKDLVAHVQGCDTHEAERFWAAQLEGVEAPSLLIDPYCVPDPTVRPSDVAYHETLMRTVDIGNAIVDFAQAHGVTVSTFLRAAVSLLLHRYTGSANPVFGTVVSGRNVPVPLAESIIGPCINTLPCRARIDRASTVDGLLQALHRDSTAAYDFEHCRLTDIHRWSGVSQEQPLFNVLFVYQNYPEEQTDSELPIQLEPRDGRDPTDVPLTLISTHSDGQLLIKASAKSHSFSPGFVGRLLDHLVAVIRALVTMPPSDPISAVDMLSSDDKRQLTRTWAQNPVDLPVCSYAHEGFLSIVQSDPSRVALRDAHRLQQSGRCGADQIVGIMAGNSVELIVGQLAIWMTGSAFVVISPDYPAERQRFILEDAACAAIIGTSATLGDIPDTVPIPQVVINLESLRSSDPTADTQEVTVTPTSLAYIIYTSGTTGTPKGVMHEHRAVAQYIQGFLGAIRITADDVTPTLLTPTFDIATSEIWLTLSVGGCLLITQDDHKVALQQATRAAITPSLLSVFEPRDFPHLLSVILGGEPCSQALADRWSSAALPRYDFAVPSHFITDLATLSPAESRLVQAVADCLHLSPSTVNLDTTFFQIGGNSLTGIQLASHCQHQGLQLTVSDFDRQSTLRQLAQRAAQVTESPAQTMLFPERSDATMYLTPAQKQFFKHDLANPQVSAIPAMFEVRRPSSEDTWQEAVAQVVLRHPMLRARFSRDPQTKQVSYTIGGTPTEHYRFQYHLAAKTEAMVAILVEAFQRLDFWTGHLSEFHVFDLVGTQYFFHCTHHLVNDYLTSALISEEVEALLLGRPLVPATVPFRVWAAHLHELAQQIDPHTLQLPPNIPSLSTSPPPDAASAGGLDHASILQSEFTAQETRSLLFDACEHHQVSQLELILAGLLLAYSEIFELEVLGLDFITHGRQPLGSEPLDVTRTVGYFAHNIPLAIIASTGLDQAASLQEVQRQLPGLLRDGPQLALVNSLHEFQDPVLREKFNVQPQISFSYLAQLTASSATQESGLFTKRPDLHQALRRVQSVNRSPYAMDITVQHKEGGLQLMIHYRADILPRSKVERFLAKWKKDLLDFRTPRA
ncbi:hypothetical protein IWQ60_008652, partial [Tieghemiomyces parasiticus]